MARKIGRLVAVQLNRLADGWHPDGGGLYLQVKGNNRSWIFRYTQPGADNKSKSRYKGIGPLHTIGLAEAREKAREYRQLLLEGKDPKLTANVRRSTLQAFEDVAARYISTHAAGWTPRYTEQWQMNMRLYANPTLGKVGVEVIDTNAVMLVLQPIWNVKTHTAKLVRQQIEMVLDFAKAQGWRHGENPARWRGHLQHSLPMPSRVAPLVHRAAMPWAEVPAFMRRLRETRRGPASKCLQFAILTACRSNEARGALVEEFDFDKAVWTIPAHRMKGRTEHCIPLSRAALELVRESIVPGRSVIFVGKPYAAGKPLAVTGLLSLMEPTPYTVHGFRSSFRDWAGASYREGRDLAEMALAHRLGDASERAYARGDLLDQRRALMDAWADHCCGSSAAAKVTPERPRLRIVA